MDMSGANHAMMYPDVLGDMADGIFSAPWQPDSSNIFRLKRPPPDASIGAGTAFPPINLSQGAENMSTSPHPAFNRLQQLMSSSPVPSISTELLVTADGELNRELNSFLFDPPSNPNLLKGKRIAICCTNGVEEVEIIGAQRWLTEHGATVHVVSPRIGDFHPTLGLRFPPLCATHVLAIRLMENAGWLKIDRYTDEAKAADYDAVLLPGGCWNPDALRADEHARAFVRTMYEAGKPTTAICHGQWVMVSAKILKGKRATAVWNIQIDLENAGATVLDEPCVIDGNLITARFPYDLPRLIKAMAQQLVGAKN
jgi:protease I